MWNRHLQRAAGAKFNSLSGGSFNIQTAADFLGGTFNNAGTLTKTTGGGGSVTRSAALNNGSTVAVQGGTLRLTSGYTQTAGVTRLVDTRGHAPDRPQPADSKGPVPSRNVVSSATVAQG
jgi:hypothetical protein